MSEPAPAIAFDGLTLRYGDHAVIADFSGVVAPGEFVAVLGPNGAGKSTLLKALLGILPPAAGRIEIFGHGPHRGCTQIGYMPQWRANAAANTLSGRAYLHAVLDGHRWGCPGPGRAREATVTEALRAVDAESFADRPFGVLSGGERQRISLAQALLGEPRILLLDEPLLNLDPRRQGELIEIVHAICQKRDVTVLFVGHDINPLTQVVDRVLYVAGGRAALGTVDEVINTDALTRLYQTPMKVLRLEDMLFILALDQRTIEHGEHHHHAH
jgi:zinc/manganese transport system ATP-binding protein